MQPNELRKLAADADARQQDLNEYSRFRRYKLEAGADRSPVSTNSRRSFKTFYPTDDDLARIADAVVPDSKGYPTPSAGMVRGIEIYLLLRKSKNLFRLFLIRPRSGYIIELWDSSDKFLDMLASNENAWALRASIVAFIGIDITRYEALYGQDASRLAQLEAGMYSLRLIDRLTEMGLYSSLIGNHEALSISTNELSFPSFIECPVGLAAGKQCKKIPRL